MVRSTVSFDVGDGGKEITGMAGTSASGITDAEVARGPAPVAFTALTVTVTAVPLGSPLIVAMRALPPTIDVLPLAEITYRSIVAPPSSTGGCHVTVTAPLPGVTSTF